MLNVQSLTKRTVAQIVVFALLLLNSTLAFAQSQVNGIVTDKTGEPLIGVNVVEKGTTNGVITDFNGQFTLNVAQGKVLVFSYVGYTTQEITVKGASLIGNGADILFNIDRVGKNLERGQGMCGSSSGSIPTDVGQPAIRVSQITVGGTANE
mgnify:CR=1 FL=1